MIARGELFDRGQRVSIRVMVAGISADGSATFAKR